MEQERKERRKRIKILIVVGTLCAFGIAVVAVLFPLFTHSSWRLVLATSLISVVPCIVGIYVGLRIFSKITK